LPFSLLLPYSSLFWTSVLSVVIGFIIASAFSAILVYAQELMPGRIAWFRAIFGLAFGMGGIGAAFLGKLADLTDINSSIASVRSPRHRHPHRFPPNLEPPKVKAVAPQRATA